MKQDKLAEELFSVEIQDLAHPVFLGKGAFSRVFRVTEKKTGRMFACKICKDKAMAERERIFLMEIKHPLFPGYHGFFRAEDSCCILMEYVCGCNLRDFVQRRGTLSETQAVRIVEALAEGLLYLHEHSRPMLYRDLKPENVMIQADGRVRLIDMGCICYIEDAGMTENAVSDIARRATRAGTPGYAAPEQFRAEVGSGRESDVYALGKLLQFMLTGKDAGEESVAGEVVIEKNAPRKDISGKRKAQRATLRKRCRQKISRPMRKLIAGTTQSEPKRRIQDMRVLLQMLSHKKAAPDFYFEKNIQKGM